MNFRHPRWLAAAALFVGLFPVGQPAAAQPGDGLKSSDGGWKLTPALTLSGGYNSNVFRTGEGEEFSSPTVDSPLGYVEPSLRISNPGARSFLLDFDASLQWEQYFGGEVTAESGGVVNPVEQSGLSAKADIAATFNPKGDVSLTLDENFTRLNEPSNFTGNGTYNWIVNRAGATVGIQPGAGILDVDLGYHWWLHYYETETLSQLDRNEHRFDLAARWRFLPKTALLVEADYGILSYSDSANEGEREDLDEPVLANFGSTPLRVQGGLSGLLTRRIAVRALAGYGWSMYEEGPSFSGVIGTAALAYTFGRLDLKNNLELGYTRDFRNSTLGNYYSGHTVFANLEAGLYERLVVMRLGGRFELRDYTQNIDGTQSEEDTGNSLNDELLIGVAGVQTNLNDWLIFDLEYNLRANFTDDFYTVPSFDGEQLNFVREYTQHIITLSTTFQY
ncbi:hypothetical protein FIV42_18895 [Persicimonas caeni]|uniref:Outer membrane beta-barrel protein n=1 Tax=Persicimonas caeni TaxID=2292766 RepID=A0A4Y6PWL8_PERCE|nr:outer membrane beta-barrel protein [Persicimonas caeni]QDG52732.1 hypothetical protein FIV42_18895 [Persicimonas caeni]QED33954.1 outer membrane beta-barrel protein [Persicimonas caeni]